MNTTWDAYPSNYRAQEVKSLLQAAHAGESVSLVGLGGAGKSNLLNYMARERSAPELSFLLVDGNRIAEPTADALYNLISKTIQTGDRAPFADSFSGLADALDRQLAPPAGSVCLMLDLSMLFSRFPAMMSDPVLMGNLRALRDSHKYQLSYLFATRHALAAQSEVSELVYARTLWLGPLSSEDAEWSVNRFLSRHALTWDRIDVASAIALSRGYPSLLRAVCDAHAAGVELESSALQKHPAVQRCAAEFWADSPSEEEIRLSGLDHLPLLKAGRGIALDATSLTAKEALLLEYLQTHAEEVSTKDDLIQAVWPEDRVFERGVRDDSLAQLVRRLREKIEADPGAPQFILTVPGRGYRFSKTG